MRFLGLVLLGLATVVTPSLAHAGPIGYSGSLEAYAYAGLPQASDTFSFGAFAGAAPVPADNGSGVNLRSR